MKTILFIFILLSNQIICLSQRSFSAFSKKIYKTQKDKDKSTFNTTKQYYKGRLMLIKKLKTKIKCPIDTLYLVEGYDLQSGEVVATVWCSLWKYNYRYSQSKIRILDYDNFSEELYRQTMLGKAKITSTKNFGDIAGSATKVFFQKNNLKIITHAFVE